MSTAPGDPNDDKPVSTAGAVGEEEATKPLKRFHFLGSNQMSHGQLGSIQELHESFARNLSTRLAGYLGEDFAFEVEEVKQQSFEEFRGSLAPSSCILCLDIQPFQDIGAIELSPSLVFPVLEILLGGTGKSPAEAERELTGIEVQLLESLFRLILNELRTVWRTIDNVEFQVSSVETKPQSLNMLPPRDLAVVTAFRVRIGEMDAAMNLAIPAAMVRRVSQEIGPKARPDQKSAGPDSADRILRRIQSGKVRVEVSIPSSGVPVRDLAGLEPGDVVVLRHSVRDPLVLRINGTEKYDGRMLARGGRRVFEMNSLLGQQNPR